MGRRKKEVLESPILEGLSVNENEGIRPFEANPEMVEKGKKKERLSIPLNEEGKIDAEGMRAETLAKARAFFHDPENQKLLGVTNVKVEEVVSEQDVAMLFDLVGTLEGWGFSIIGKIDADIAAAHARWTDKQKEMVVKPAQAVISKNASSMAAFLRWKDEIVLGVIFLAISRAKYEAARNDQKLREASRASGRAEQTIQGEGTPEVFN